MSEYMKNLPKNWLLGLVVLTIVIVLILIFWLVKSPPQANSTVKTVALERLTLPLIISANGLVTPERLVNVSPKTAGKLKALRVKEGRVVPVGEILALMDDTNLQGPLHQAQGDFASAQANLQRLVSGSRPEEIAQAQARLQDAQAAAYLAQSTLQQDEILANSGAISERALDTSRNAHERAQTEILLMQQALLLVKKGPRSEDIDQAKAQVLAARGALETIQTQINDMVIRAPFAGIVTRKYAEPGAFVAPTTAGSVVSSATSSSILSLAGTNLVIAKVAEANIGQIRLGQAVALRADAFVGKTFRGRVSEIAPQSVIEQNVTSFEVKVLLLDQPNPLRSGMNVDAEFEVGQLRNALMVPTVAIVRQERQTGVYQMDSEQKPVFTEITTGATIDTRTQVLSGLTGQEHIFVSFPEGFRPETKLPGMR